MFITKRNIVRLIAFPSAAIICLIAALFITSGENANTKLTLENHYIRAVQELSHNLENIKNTLHKGIHSNSPSMLTTLSAKLTSDTNAAKANISQLPVEELDLAATYKFLSQVGNYSNSLSKRVSGGEELTDEERGNLKALHDFSVKTSENMWNVEKQLQDGVLNFKTTILTIHDAGSLTVSAVKDTSHISDGFQEMEGVFEDYPMLIYDGPFSDHIMQKDPLLIKHKREINVDEALKNAEFASGAQNLSLISAEEGSMPSYVFSNNNTTVAITKAGGFMSYMLNYRAVETERITAEQATEASRNYLSKLGVTEVTETYYETRGGICIINFAATQAGVTLYTDLIKVGVAMDTGEIVSYDARGYLVNHTRRALSEPILSEHEAMLKLSPLLTAESSKLCVIPSDGLNELFCYEFKCSSVEGQVFLVYINVNTGEEERILLLNVSENGTLAV